MFASLAEWYIYRALFPRIVNRTLSRFSITTTSLYDIYVHLNYVMKASWGERLSKLTTTIQEHMFLESVHIPGEYENCFVRSQLFPTRLGDMGILP